MTRLAFLLLFAPAALLAACGGSKPATASSTATTTSVSSTPSSTTTTTTTRPPEVPPGTKTGSSTSTAASGSSTTPGGSTHVRLPATFTIRGGSLQPPAVSAPAFVAVNLTMVSGDGRAHTVLVRTPIPGRLRVPAHGRASELVPGLRAGRYVIEVDGVIGGALVIGGEPGP